MSDSLPTSWTVMVCTVCHRPTESWSFEMECDLDAFEMKMTALCLYCGHRVEVVGSPWSLTDQE